MQPARTTLETPLGPYVLIASPEGITHFQPAGGPKLPAAASDRGDAAARRTLDVARLAFEAYFAGDTAALGPMPLAPVGTPFRQRVWRALREIAPGETLSYGEVARRLGVPGAARAVGSANHHNPIAVAIPCHRVVGSDGRLVGYAGGLHRKRWLLAHESAWTATCDYAASSKSKDPSARPESAEARSRASAAASI